jgi:hypothetical protein
VLRAVLISSPSSSFPNSSGEVCGSRQQACSAFRRCVLGLAATAAAADSTPQAAWSEVYDMINTQTVRCN